MKSPAGRPQSRGRVLRDDGLTRDGLTRDDDLGHDEDLGRRA
jgi:hypothetical protein